MTRQVFSVVLAASLVGLGATDLHAQSSGPWQTYGTENGEWRSYAGNIAGQIIQLSNET